MTYRKSLRLGVVAALTLSGALAAVPAAAADPGVRTQARSVRFDDLSLSTPEGVKTLYNRIRNAAIAVCGPSERTGTRIVSQDWKDCVSGAIRDAVIKLNQSPLTTYYAQHLRDPSFTTTG